MEIVDNSGNEMQFCSIFDIIRNMSELGLEYVERNKYTRSFAFMLNDKTDNESEAKNGWYLRLISRNK